MSSPKHLTTAQFFKALAIIPKVASVFSLFGSAYIIRHVFWDPKRRRQVRFRLLGGLAISDVIMSIGSFLSTWPIPVDQAGPVWGAAGNEATCNAQGFIMQLTVAGSLYNASLALYYLLAVVHGWTEEKCKKLEPVLHAVPVLYGLATAIAGLVLNAYANATLWCHFGADELRLGLTYSIVWGTSFLNVYCMGMISWKVWKTERANLRYSQQSGEQRDNFKQTKLVAVQGFFYCFSYILTWIFPSVYRVLEHQGKPTNFVLLGFVAWFPCFQGMTNFLVFIRPKLVERYRERGKRTASTAAVAS